MTSSSSSSSQDDTTTTSIIHPEQPQQQLDHRFYAIRKCPSLKSPAIFTHWEDCRVHVVENHENHNNNNNENHNVSADDSEYKIFPSIHLAVKYIQTQQSSSTSSSSSSSSKTTTATTTSSSPIEEKQKETTTTTTFNNDDDAGGLETPNADADAAAAAAAAATGGSSSNNTQEKEPLFLNFQDTDDDETTRNRKQESSSSSSNQQQQQDDVVPLLLVPAEEPFADVVGGGATTTTQIRQPPPPQKEEEEHIEDQNKNALLALKIFQEVSEEITEMEQNINTNDDEPKQPQPFCYSMMFATKVIGLELQKRNNVPKVTAVLNPEFEGIIEVGDSVDTIGGKKMAGKSMEEVAQFMSSTYCARRPTCITFVRDYVVSKEEEPTAAAVAAESER